MQIEAMVRMESLKSKKGGCWRDLKKRSPFTLLVGIQLSGRVMEYYINIFIVNNRTLI